MLVTHPAHDNESEAADWIAGILRGSACRRDIPPEQGTHDYDIVMPDGSSIAVEITRHISEADAEYTGITEEPQQALLALAGPRERLVPCHRHARWRQAGRQTHS